MSKTLKHIFNGIACTLLTGCIIAAYIAGQTLRKPVRCKDINVEITDSSKNCFVTQADVKLYISKSYGEVKGKMLDSLKLDRIEQIVDSRSAVYKSQAFVTKDGILNVRVTQRRPIVRFQKKDGGFYADEEGCIFPLQRSYSSHVQVIDGNIPLKANSGHKGVISDPAEREWFEQVLSVVNFMEKDKLWKNKIVQIHIEQNGDMILIPREGKERFLFGQPDEIEKKFRKMEKYYTHILPYKSDGYYRYVDLKYDGQIVCRR